ncbi:hypothetical protein B0H14DRAFT_2651655 [Mycena olivaceomarginata]|nr:hypothetical protein B0H14DRAFT_2651655 [Mycena olivaceomarginata]
MSLTRQTSLQTSMTRKSGTSWTAFFKVAHTWLHRQHEVNPYHTFKSEKAAELRASRTPMNMGQIHNAFHQEYTELTDAEKAALAERHKQDRNGHIVRRDSPCARVQSPWPVQP